MDAANAWHVIIEPHATCRYLVRCKCLGRPGLEMVEPLPAISCCCLTAVLEELRREHPTLAAVVFDDPQIAPRAWLRGQGIKLICGRRAAATGAEQ